MLYTRREAIAQGLEALTIGSLGFLSSCNRSRHDCQETLYGEPVICAKKRLHTGNATTISQAGDYLTGTYSKPIDPRYRLNFRFKDTSGREVRSHLLLDTVPEELSPQNDTWVGNKRWVIPLMNFASHGNGPFLLYEIGIFDRREGKQVKKIESAEVEIQVPARYQGWEQPQKLQRIQPVRLSMNAATEQQKRNVNALHALTDLFVRYQGPRVQIKEGTYDYRIDAEVYPFAPVHLTPLWQYDEGLDRNTQMVKRFSQILVHLSVFGLSPFPHTRKIIVDRIGGGGKAWKNGFRAAENGVSGKYPCCAKQEQPVLPKNQLLVDAHETAHVIDLNNSSNPYIREFKSISWEKNLRIDEDTRLLEEAVKKQDWTIDDFITEYAMTDDLEDLADTAGHSVAFGEAVREYIIGKEKAAQKYHLVKTGLLKEIDWTCKDVEILEQQA